MNELEALVILSAIPGLGSLKIRILIHKYGSAVDALGEPSEEIAALPGFGPKIAMGWDAWKKEIKWQRNLELAQRNGTEIIAYNEKQYPKRLLSIPDHPVLLYVKGTFTEPDSRCLAVVGTRQAGIYGLEMAEQISCGLAARGFTVVSGLARGIDTAAHKGALRRGRTIGVIGSGLANIYPRENSGLAEAISQNGVLISEFPMDTPPDRQNFPQRNRIVSGMTLGTVLIEAPMKSGAMITMEKAFNQNRCLFAIPGRADNANFSGNHSLIKHGQALLVENADDIAAQFEDLFGSLSPMEKPFVKKTYPLDQEEVRVLEAMPGEEQGIDAIASLTKLPISKLNVLLMTLLLKQAIKEYPGKRYKKVLHL